MEWSLSRGVDLHSISHPYLSDEQAARTKLEAMVWPQGPVCPHCGEADRSDRRGRQGRARAGEILRPLRQTVSRDARDPVRGQPCATAQMVSGVFSVDRLELRDQRSPAAFAARSRQQDGVEDAAAVGFGNRRAISGQSPAIMTAAHGGASARRAAAGPISSAESRRRRARFCPSGAGSLPAEPRRRAEASAPRCHGRWRSRLPGGRLRQRPRASFWGFSK